MALLAPPIGASNNIAPFFRPPSLGGAPTPSWGSFGGALAASAAISATLWGIGELGGNKFRDGQLAKLKGIEPNTGFRDGKPPFEGGQSAGVLYKVALKMTYSDAPTRYYLAGGGMGTESPISDSDVRIGGIPVEGAFTGELTTSQANAISVSVYYKGNNFGNVLYVFGADFKVSVYKVVRVDGQPDTGGNPPSAEPSKPAGFNGDRTPSNDEPRIVPPSLSPALGWGNGKPVTNGIAPALGIGNGAVSPSNFNDGKTKPDNLAPSPKAPPLPNTPPNSVPKPTPTPSESDKPKSPIPTPPTPDSSNNSIMQKLIEVGAILGFINANTQPSAQRVNAKNGTCDAMQSPSCTQGFENRIKDPINQNIDAKTGLLAANQAGQDIALGAIAAEQQVQKGVLATIAAKATDIFDLIGRLWNNSLVDKAVGFITMITAFHNAAMLSRSIADTLASAIDSGLVAVGWGIQDKDGNMIGVNQAIGNTIQDLIRKAIGNQAYENLNNTWINANRVYQASINLVSNVQNILDSTTAIAELTSNRVGTLMNALRNAGMVRENAYGAQSQNVTRFNTFMNKLESLEQGTSNVASITGNIVSVQQSVNELKSNRQEFENALKNKPQGSGLPENDPEKQATQTKKAQSIYTIGDFSVVKPPETP